MKNILFAIALLISFVSFGQTPIDGYKYASVFVIEYDDGFEDEYGLSKKIKELFKELQIITIDDNQMQDFMSKKNPCELLTVSYLSHAPKGRWRQTVTIEITNCLGETVLSDSATAGNDMSSSSRDIKTAAGKIFWALKGYKFNPALTPKLPEYKLDNKLGLDISSEPSIRQYFDDNGAELIEGIWEYSSTHGKDEYKLLIIKDPEDDYKFKCIIIESNDIWRPGEEKAVFETAATDEFVTIKWVMTDKINKVKSGGAVTNNALIEFNITGGEEVVLYKVYPKFSKNTKKTIKTGEWAGNGSGIIISKSGHIVTNYHVIDDADEIEVEFILNNEVQKFNAEVVQVDKVNDLAIIKIFDMNFDGVDEPPYNFKIRSSEVGTKVYAYGYPMALSIMGKEIKVTDGMISSKSGFDGDITTYQITAPIQGGNSGGPLFDEKGNLLGINSSGIDVKVADNVAYTIKSSYIVNLIDVLPKNIDLPSNTKLQSLPLTEQIKEIAKYVVLIKVK
tara:strand:- start:50 stop:1567 length:1518 start_codon:yes stop_codon:yes gene_type:complete